MSAAWRRRQAIVMLTLALCAALAGPRVERIGDRLQIALPVAALGCALAGGGAGELLLRFAVTSLVLHATKNGLGQTRVNLRPSGGHRGLPSGHTTAAAFGASALVRACLDAPAARAATVISAGVVGGSRIEAGAHSTGQVAAGAALGIAGDRVARDRPTRERLRTALRALARRLVAAARPPRRVPMRAASAARLASQAVGRVSRIASRSAKRASQAASAGRPSRQPRAPWRRSR